MKKLDADALAGFGEDTKLILTGRDPARFDGFVNPPVFHASTVLSPSVKVFLDHSGRYHYARRGTPTSDALEEALRVLEGGAGVVLCPSGLSAVTTALLAVLSAGDHILVTDTAYGPTRTVCDETLGRFGIEVGFYDPALGAAIEGLFRPNTRAVYCESPGSLTFDMQDIPAIAAVAHRHDAVVLTDNTWASPYFYKPHDHGVDLSIMAGTKYVVGHSDSMLGTISASERVWKKLHRFYGNSGLCVGPDDMYLALRGLRTMAVRLNHHQAAALKVASWLETQPEVSRVLHPALPSHPGHALFQRDFRGSSGLFSLIMKPGPMTAVGAFLDHLQLFGLGVSWGGYESLAIPFDCTAQRTVTQWKPEGPCIRLHIGLEDVDDLIADLAAGLKRYAAAC